MSPSTIRTLIVALIAFVAALSSAGFMVYKLHRQEGLLAAQLAALGEERAKEEVLYALKKTAGDSATAREQLGGYLVGQESDSINILNWFEQTAPRAGVSLKIDTLMPFEDQTTKTKWVEVSLTFSGTRVNVERFIELAEHLPYLSYVTGLSLTARTSDTWEANLRTRVLIFTYAQ